MTESRYFEIDSDRSLELNTWQPSSGSAVTIFDDRLHGGAGLLQHPGQRKALPDRANGARGRQIGRLGIGRARPGVTLTGRLDRSAPSYGIGLVLIGMPGLEKRLARYPQLYSRVGFVHEFKPLSPTDVRQLLREGWAPARLSLSEEGLIDDEAIATLIRIAEGKFPLLHRLLQQIGRVMEINGLDKVTAEVVEAARESLVIGKA
jgi:hypothetical protein